MDNLFVEFDQDSSVARLMINQPQKRNAISMDMWIALPQILQQLTDNPAVKVVILTGTGEHFAGGADISEFEQICSSEERRVAFSEVVEATIKCVAECPKPILAMIRGSCVGAGCALAAACDIRFADETARFGIPPAKLGLVYSLANTRRLAELVGRGRAADLLFTGRTISAESAINWGLTDYLETSAELAEKTQVYALSICNMSQNSLQITKRILRRVSQYYPDDDSASWQEFLDTFQSDDFREGYRAFLEKRPPSFDHSDDDN